MQHRDCRGHLCGCYRERWCKIACVFSGCVNAVALQVKTPHKTAIFREINKGRAGIHRDALEFPDGNVVLLTRLYERQEATVLQLPAETRAPVEGKRQEVDLIAV